MKKYVVSSYPYLHSGNDTNKMFIYMAISLVLPMVFGYLFFGINTLAIVVVSIVSCYLAETLFNIFNGDNVFSSDFSFFVTAMILALTLPLYTPTYVVIISGFVAIYVSKMVFGGLGKNKFNPALIGRCFAGIFSSAVASEYYKFVIDGELYVSLSEGGTNTIYNLIMGKAIGGIGTTNILIILLCFIFLAYTETLDMKIPIISIISYFCVGLLLNNVEMTTMNMLSGSFIFTSVFIITDPNTSPDLNISKIMYAVIFGALSAILWNLSVLKENAVFVAALIANFLAPLFDKYIFVGSRKLGGFRNAYKV